MTDASFVVATRDSYDAVAAAYAETVAPHLAGMPFERALFAAFAELVRAGGNGSVADVGCGPGHVTALLHQLGLDAFGIDLSPEMVALARRSYPRVRFEEGSMLALDLPDASLGGLLAYYSIIHIPWERRPRVFAEFHRVLARRRIVDAGLLDRRRAGPPHRGLRQGCLPRLVSAETRRGRRAAAGGGLRDVDDGGTRAGAHGQDRAGHSHGS